MNHEEQRLWLIRTLQADGSPLSHYPIPEDAQGQKKLLRALMNVWMPHPLPEEFWQVQDEYLTEENRRGGVTDVDSIPPAGADPRIRLWQGDLTTLAADAIVNPANSGMLGCFQPLHSCLDNQIHSKAGLALRACCAMTRDSASQRRFMMIVSLG